MPAIPLNPCAFPCEGCLKSEKRTLHAASSRTPARAVPPGTLLEEVSSPTKKIHDLSRRGWNYIVLAQFPCRNHPLSFRMILAATEVYPQSHGAASPKARSCIRICLATPKCPRQSTVE